jgi:hypothetical protein
MAYVQGYEHDVFVSYAHVDNEQLPGMSSGWVTALIESLDVFVNQKVKHSGKVDIWIDHKLAGNAPLTDTLMKTVENTATMLVVLSNRYMNSAWCEKEREAFLDHVEQRARGASRVFLVVPDRLEFEERVPQFRDIAGYDFWVLERKSDSSRRLGVPQPKPEEAEYWSKLDDLATDLATELDRQRTEPEVSSSKEPSRAVSGRTAVFLAQTTEDIATDRAVVKRSLGQAGFVILPDANSKPYSREADEYKSELKKDLGRATLFVQMLSRLAGKNAFLSDLPKGFVRAQYDWAKETEIEIIQWRDRGLDVESIADDDHKKLLKKPTVQAVGLEEFKQTIERKLRAAEKLPVSSESLPTMLHVSAEEDDSELIDAICTTLEKREDLVGYDLEETDDLEFIRKCWDGIIFVYGDSKPERVSRRVRKWYKTLAGTSPLSLALYVGPPPAPPEPKPRIGVKPPKMVAIDGQSGLNEQGLLDFIDKVHREKVRRESKGASAGATTAPM